MDQGLAAKFAAYIQRNSGYLARAEIRQILSEITDPKRLEPFGFKVYSQNEEDGILEEIFRRLGIETGRFVEIGVEDGLECNTLYLIHKGWRGAWIEGNLDRREALESRFASILKSRLTLGFGVAGVDNINAALAQLGAVETELDFLSIDIDGNDIYLFEALDVRPKVVCIEYNAKFPAHMAKQQVHDPARFWHGTDYMGSSLKALWQAAQRKGYRLVGTNITGANAFFVRDDLAGELFPDDASPEALYNPPRYWLFLDHFLFIGHPPDFGPYVDLVEP